ncbi:MAG: MBL fold metallo-hydrolase [Casimicrobium sp.]
MKLYQFFDLDSSTYTYLLVDPTTGEAVLIDPVDTQLERDLVAIKTHAKRLAWVIETHAHADHITSAAQLVEHTGARVAVPSGCGIANANVQLHDKDTLTFGVEKITALHTPGHTYGSMSFLWRNNVFTGDTLLIDGCGRTDFQSGSAESLYRSITEVLFALPDETVVWPAHDYKGRTSSTIGHERLRNARVAGKTSNEFITTMNALQLPKPRRIDEAVPANLWLGIRHDAESMADGAIRAAAGYAGDISPATAYAWWRSDEAVLVDIRTDAEREWVGFVPDAAVVAWKQWPGMAINPSYDAEIRALANASDHKPFVMLCRSGVRSIASAKRATELGVVAYNILEGFEGNHDANGHRNVKEGWRARGLPWKQN